MSFLAVTPTIVLVYLLAILVAQFCAFRVMSCNYLCDYEIENRFVLGTKCASETKSRVNVTSTSLMSVFMI